MKTVKVEKLVTIKGIAFPDGDRFRQFIITGPPCSGKTTLVNKLGGWSEEGYLDLAQKNWWRNQLLTFRPREIHFGFPFKGHQESLAVFEQEWLESPAGIDFDRVQIPPKRKGFFLGDWQEKYVFDFQLPSPESIFAVRKERSRRGTHVVDRGISLEQVQRQVAIYQDLAVYFHQQGLRVIVRDDFQSVPRRIIGPRGEPS